MGSRHAVRAMRCDTPRTRAQDRAKGASHPARLVAALFGVDAPSQFAALRGSKAGDAREVTCAASLGARGGGENQRRAPKTAQRKAGPGPGVRRSLSRRSLTPLKYTRASNSQKTPIGPVLQRHPPCPGPRVTVRGGAGLTRSPSHPAGGGLFCSVRTPCVRSS